jgi:hypothetical protein
MMVAVTKYVILGHGTFSPTSGGYAPEVLVPTDTTLSFFSDAGQALVLPSSNYGKVAGSIWDQLEDEGDPLGPKKVTYNFTLFPDSTPEHRENARKADWGGASVVYITEGRAFLCTGTAETCPTPALLVAEREGEEIDPERWKHGCNGILGQLQGSSNEIYWVACTSISVGETELPVLESADVTGPGLEEDRDWLPTEAEYDKIADKNGANVKATGNGGDISVVAGGGVVLIGPGHPRRPADYVRRQADIEEGSIKVTKGGAFSKGAFQVTGISKKQTLVREALKDFSDKKITFV